MRRSKSWTLDERGSALIAFILASAVSLVICMTLIDSFTTRAIERGQSRIASARNRLIMQISRAIRPGLTLKASTAPAHLAENRMLKDCAYSEPGDDPSDCVSRDFGGTPWYNGAFYDDDDVKISGSTPATAAYYHENGEICGAADSTCAFQVWTEYSVVCEPVNWWSCPIARNFVVRIHIRTFNALQSVFGGTTTETEEVATAEVPVEDWRYGQWIVGLANDAVFSRGISGLQMAPPAAPVVVSGPSGGGGGGPPPPPPPAPATSGGSCPAGQRSTGNGCAPFSF